MPLTTLLEEVLEAWRYTRVGVITEIENLSETDLRFTPHAESRAPADIAFHIVESGLMMAGELSRADGNFQRKSFPQFMKEYARGVRPTTNKKALIQMLTRTHADGERKIRKAGELHMLQLITRFDGERGTRLAWMNHGIAHEEYHRGQLALNARLMGRVPALTQLIYGTAKPKT
jgi:uncharacterized damage-inducible protein DinB